MKAKQLGMRLDPDVVRCMDALAKIHGITRAKYVTRLVCREASALTSECSQMETLTACKDCAHGRIGSGIDDDHAYRPGELSRDEFAGQYMCRVARAFEAWEGELVLYTALCSKINIDGHCPYFEAKKTAAELGG